MSVKFTSRLVEGVNVIDASGRISVAEGSGALRDALNDLTGRNQKKILLNLADVSYIDSSGIRELMVGLTAVINLGGQLKLVNLNKRLQDLLQITRLHTVFEVHDDEASAIRSFQ